MYVEAGKGKVDITEGIALPKDVFDAAQFAAIQDRAEVVGVDVRGDLPVSVTVVPADFTGELAKSGAYEMSINGDGIAIKAFDKVGAFYAVQSIFGLVDSQNADSLPQLSIQDAPRFDYRGVMVDVARNFHSKDAILATLDQMAAYKMNKLHLHLTDDEGWRLEIPGLPELTEVGSNRCFDLEEKVACCHN